MLHLDSVTTGYGKVSVVFDVSLDVPEGALVAVLGVNGAGKTTLLRAVMGLLPVRSGTITFDGSDITRLRTNQRVRRGLAYVPQGQQSFGQLTTKENLLLVADRYGTQGRNEWTMRSICSLRCLLCSRAARGCSPAVSVSNWRSRAP